MKRWKVCSILIFVLALGALGCGGGNGNSGITLVISPTAVSVITNTTEQFSSLVTGSSNTTVTWTVACATGVAANTCGTIDTNGLYTAPATLPTATVSGTVTPEPTVTITGTSAADTTKTESAVVTIITGITISITPSSATVGTGEQFTNFGATVTNPGCNQNTDSQCLAVTWSLPTTATNNSDGTITGTGVVNGVAGSIYTAPATAPSPNSITITATSVKDTTVTATATVTIVTASDPTVSFVSPTNAGQGSLFQDIYITGTNFISTSVVKVNATKIDPSLVTDISSTVIRARISANLLVQPFVPQSGILAVTVSQQVGTPQSCADPSKCQIVVAGVRPAIVGPSPDSIPQGTAGVQTFNVDGGFFGTTTNPSVNVTYDGQGRAAAVTGNTTRQLSINIGGSSNSQDFSLSGLHQVSIRSNSDPTKFAATNLAVQPNVNTNPPAQITGPMPNGGFPVGTTPSDVAVNPATGMAVVANTGSDNVTLIDISNPTATPVVLVPSLCTGALGAATTSCPKSGPVGVAVAHLISPSIKNIALVVNATAKTISEIDLDAKTVIWVSPPLQDTPAAVGINPVSGRALVAMNFQFYGLLIDLTPTTPVILGPVTIGTGPKTHIAVEPHLNWAVATPGGAGSVGIVNLSSMTTNTITSVKRTTQVVTVTVQPSTPQVPQSPLALQTGDAVQILGVSNNSFNGIYRVSQVGPGSTFAYSQTGAVSTLPDVPSFNTAGTVNYSEPVSTPSVGSASVQGIAINPETITAILADPSSSGTLSFYNLANLVSTPLSLTNASGGAEPGAAAAAYNSLTNTAYVVNPTNLSGLGLSVIDPTKPQRLPGPTSISFPTGNTPIAVAVDSASNRLIVVNQGENSAWIYSLGNINTTRALAITESNPKTVILNSTLTSAPASSAQTLTILGNGFSGGSVARLDGASLSTTFVSNRILTAIVPPSLLSTARRFSLDVLDSGNVSNTTDFTVEQSIDVTSCSTTPLPSAVSIDAQQNIAAVSLAGCNSLALISLSNGTGSLVAVGTSPIGVAVIPRLHQVVVANNGSNNASVVDALGATVTSTLPTGTGSQGAAADQDTGEVAIANSGANDVTVVNATTGGTSTMTTDQFPVAVGFNYQNHQVAVATDGGGPTSQGSVDVADGGASSAARSFSVSQPTSVVYNPVTGSLGNDCGSISNLVGCFLVNDTQNHAVNVLDPVAGSQSSFSVGVQPTSIAYNYLTSTLVATNTASHTVTVIDFLSRQVRAVLSLPPAPINSNISRQGILQFTLDINPLTNLAVIADTANGRVLFIPVPR